MGGRPRRRVTPPPQTPRFAPPLSHLMFFIFQLLPGRDDDASDTVMPTHGRLCAAAELSSVRTFVSAYP